MRRWLIIWGGGILTVLLVAIFVLAYFIDEPLRRRVEREMNARLKGYTIRIEKLDFHPIGLSLDLEKLWIYQTPQPDPPIAYIPNLHASVHWKALLSGRLVGDFQLDDPKIHYMCATSPAAAGRRLGFPRRPSGFQGSSGRLP
jgi:hypothetical protein